MANLSSIVKQLKKERDRVAKQLWGMKLRLGRSLVFMVGANRVVNGGSCQRSHERRSPQRRDGVGLR
jgi:hypothetical protein